MEARVQQTATPPRPAMTSSEWFQELRPCCVEISQIAIRQPDSPEATRKLTQLTEQLHEILKKASLTNPLNPKLAEYVFFPLSHIFRQMEVFPRLLVENCLKCLQVLIQYGWATELSGDLARQLLSLLVVVIDGKPGSAEKSDIPEETLLEGFRTMSTMFGLPHAFKAWPSLVQNDFLPTTGHAISVVLDALEGAPYAQVQIEAGSVMNNVFRVLKTQDAFEAFLPGTVSSFVKLLSTPAKYKSAVIAKSVSSLGLILVSALGDVRVQQCKWGLAGKKVEGVEETEEGVKFEQWVKASIAQIKLALGSVVKLRKTESALVAKTLYKFCIDLLDECHTSLWNCASILLETAVILSGEQGNVPKTTPSLPDLILIHPELGEILKNTVYDWMTSLPRQMQASDDRAKQAAFGNLTKGIDILKKSRIESATLEDALSSSLTDSMVVLLSQTRTPSSGQSAQIQLLTDGNNAVSGLASADSPYQNALIAHDNTGDLRESIIDYLGAISSLPQKSRVAGSLMQNLQGSASSMEVASLWLSFELSKTSEACNADVDALLNFGDDGEDDATLGELYSFAVDSLGAYTDLDSGDWRLSFISMEIVSHAAAKSGAQFRPELIDVLFPVATFLGSDNEQLRQQAIATLNSVAISCQYGSVSELLIANVDYVVNSVSLRLNSLDISPASIAVLTMMVRLAGPRLVPFLDDVVDSIFAALDNYHGYTSFVESLFSVLNEIVGASVKADKALLTSTGEQAPVHRKIRAQTSGFQGILDYLEKEKKRQKDNEEEEATGKRPEGPFTHLTQEEHNEEDPDSNAAGREVEKPANPPTYQLLLRIAFLTQHYLTSPTPKLRRSLLDVLSTASPVLSANEDAFLPLVNSVWPVVFDRLYDDERYVAIEACRALASLCAASGDFLSSRFKTVWWDGMGAWCKRCKSEAASQNKRGGTSRSSEATGNILLPYQTEKEKSSTLTMVNASKQPQDGGLGQHASQAKLWEGVVGLLIAMVTYVRMEDEMFDEILDLLAGELEKNPEALEALEVVNADAVWLVRFERGRVEVGEPPRIGDFGFVDVQSLSPMLVS